MKFLPLFVLSLVLLIPASGFAQEAPKDDAPEITLKKLVAVRNLRCDALQRGKQATTSANIHRSQQKHARGGLASVSKQEIVRFERTAGAAFEEAGGLKRRLQRMSETLINSNREAWYATVDIAQRIRIEKRILAAQEIVEEPCGR